MSMLTVSGRLFFEDWKPGTPRRPLHHFELELWERRPNGRAHRLVGGSSDLEGAFALSAQASHALELRLYELQRSWAGDGSAIEHRHLVHVIDVDRERPDLGDVAVPYWPYCYNSPLPRVHIPPGGQPPQEYPRGRKVALMQATSAIGLVRARHHAELPSLDAIQRDYPENLTLRLEREDPGVTRSDAFFGERILNGFNPCLPVPDPRYPGELRVGFTWDDCEQDGVHVLPNATAWFTEREGRLMPTRIALQERLYTPADGEGWARAKRLFRCSWSLDGQIVGHLTKAHLAVEQYAVAAFRNLRRNPLRDLLFGHLKDVVIINHGGTDLIFGERGYVTVASALTAGAIANRFVKTLGTLDWKGWQPRRSLGPGHLYARAANRYWALLGQHVAEFFAEHAEAIAREWPEIQRFSEDLVTHAVPFVPCDAAEECADQAAPRVAIDGVVKAVSPVTSLDDLAALCRYLIFHATFFHAWANDRQHDDGGELRYNALSLRGTGWGPEEDDTIAQTPAEATEQLFLALYLQNTRYGYLLKNEDGDVPHRLVELLHDQVEAFRAIGFDAGTIRSCINI